MTYLEKERKRKPKLNHFEIVDGFCPNEVFTAKGCPFNAQTKIDCWNCWNREIPVEVTNEL